MPHHTTPDLADTSDNHSPHGQSGGDGPHGHDPYSGHGSHGHGGNSAPAAGRVRLMLGAMLIPLVAATLVAMVILWPAHRTIKAPDGAGVPAQLVNGTITRLITAGCSEGLGVCDTVTASLTSGPERHQSTTFVINEGPGTPGFHQGDKIVLGRSVDPYGQVAYYFADFQRKSGLFILGAVFAVLVVLVARWRGFGALAGLIITWAAVTQFILPALLQGRSAVSVALTGSAVIVIVVLYVAHGFNARTTTAMIGTLLSLGLTGALATFAVSFTNLTGLSSDEATYVQNYAGNVSIHGLLLGGIVIGSLGVLNDMTVTQASAVWEIHQAQPSRNRWALYRAGMRVGRDHIASTVYTLVLAYTGAALPLLIVFTLTGRHFVDAATSDIVAEEITRTLVGAIGLVASVPLTTLLACIVVGAQPVPESGSAVDPDVTELDPDVIELDEGPPGVVDLDEGPRDVVELDEAPTPAVGVEDRAGHVISASRYRGVDPLPPLPTYRRRFGFMQKRHGTGRAMTRRERRFWSEG